MAKVDKDAPGKSGFEKADVVQSDSDIDSNSDSSVDEDREEVPTKEQVDYENSAEKLEE